MNFQATLETRGSGHVVALPFDVRETFRTTTMPYGGVDYVGLNRKVRKGASVNPGDRISVELERDTEPREVDVPPELAQALVGDAAAKAAFDRLSYTHRKEYARWTSEAKREETRERRLAKAVEMLRAGVRTPG